MKRKAAALAAARLMTLSPGRPLLRRSLGSLPVTSARKTVKRHKSFEKPRDKDRNRTRSESKTPVDPSKGTKKSILQRRHSVSKGKSGSNQQSSRQSKQSKTSSCKDDGPDATSDDSTSESDDETPKSKKQKIDESEQKTICHQPSGKSGETATPSHSDSCRSLRSQENKSNKTVERRSNGAGKGSKQNSKKSATKETHSQKSKRQQPVNHHLERLTVDIVPCELNSTKATDQKSSAPISRSVSPQSFHTDSSSSVMNVNDESEDECVIISEVKGPSSNHELQILNSSDRACRKSVTDSFQTEVIGSVVYQGSAMYVSAQSNPMPKSCVGIDCNKTLPKLNAVRGTSAALINKISQLEGLLACVQQELNETVKQKDDEILKLKETSEEEIIRLSNRLKWQEEQLEELNRTAEKNLELEAKIGFMLSSREAYEEEVAKALENESRSEVSGENENESEHTDLDNSDKQSHKAKGKKRKIDGELDELADIEELFVGRVDVPELPVNISTPLQKPESMVSKTQSIVTRQETEPTGVKGRHEIRRLMTKLEMGTKVAGKLEADRRERVKKLHEKHLIRMSTDETQQPVCEQLVLAFEDDSCTEAVVEVDSNIVRQLKPHQVDAVEFLWDNLVESLDRLKVADGDPGSGCILAHCMGLGKTLSVIAFIHTLLTSRAVDFHSCLILAPLNAVLNWVTEWQKWVVKKCPIKVYELATRQSVDRIQVISDWKKTGGILVMGYQLFRCLASYRGRSKKTKETYESSLIDPGADIIVCDEGHLLKNDASALSKCVNRVRTRRRIVLTGTPLQNNLIEYHCMVSFVKPNLLGSRREFCNRFVNPITNGQHSDSTLADVQVMKRRAHVLHEMLSGCVQRRDYTALVQFLPPKHEYVIGIHLSPLQIDLYQEYLDQFTQISQVSAGGSKMQAVGLFADYQCLMRIWTHPWVLKLEEIRQDKKPLTFDDDDELDDSVLFTSSSEEEVDEVTNDDETSSSKAELADDKSNGGDVYSKSTSKHSTKKDTDDAVDAVDNDEACEKLASVSGEENDAKKEADEIDISVPKARVLGGEVIRQWQSRTRSKGSLFELDFELPARHEEQWWSKYLKDEDKFCIEHSGKLVLLFEIIQMAQQIGDKVLVFSQSLLSLDLIEDFLFMKTEQATLHNSTITDDSLKSSVWVKDEDYVRMDGSTGALTRKRFTTNFNDASNERLRLFLISTKAGGLGINLDTANRVIIFDASWNPSHDIQSIFRVYRFGQTKPVYIYRFLAQGTMEEKIYDRQITKETLSQRVVDEHQIDRHFTAADLRELYSFKPARLDDPNAPKRPIPAVPKDVVLAELLSTPCLNPWIVSYHEHDSLLENRPEENLTEDERKAAWDEYEREKFGIYVTSMTNDTPDRTYPKVPYKPMVTKVELPTLTYDRATQGVVTTLTEKDLEIAASQAVQVIPLHLRTKFSFQIQQMPKVVHEILKYNPSISAENLQKRLAAFLGMHTRTVDASNGKLNTSFGAVTDTQQS